MSVPRAARPSRACFCIAALTICAASPAHAAEHAGQVAVGALPVPGATVTAVQGDTELSTSTGPDGTYRFDDLADGVWTMRVEMVGFAPVSRSVTVAPGAPPEVWQLTLLPFEEIARTVPAPAPASGTSASANAPSSPGVPSAGPVLQRADVTPSSPPRSTPPPDPEFRDAPVDSTGMGAAAGLLINGSVNNGAASPFAQLAAFGNNRQGQRWLYNGGLGVLMGNSAWDARPYSFSDVSTPKPDYGDLQFLGTVGGPFGIPGLFGNGGQFTAGYQRSVDNGAVTIPARLPTALERAGDFSQSVDASGRPEQIVDPLTGLPFEGNRIPRERLSPQAAALAAYYPEPSIDSPGYNFQAPVLTTTRQDNVQSRLQRQITRRDGIVAAFSFGRTVAENSSLLGFDNVREGRALNAEGTFTHRFSPFLALRARYHFTRDTNETRPHFSGVANISGGAGIAGNDQSPLNWGPPRLVFASGLEPLSDAPYVFSRARTNGWSAETFLTRGRHTFTFGGGVRRHAIDLHAQQDARGTFTFTGAATGVDFADFLLGLPQASSIAFGNADTSFSGNSYDLYFSDDWRVAPGLTLNAGARWEYEAPLTERFGRLVNLDISPGFGEVEPVVATSPLGALTGTTYPDSLVFPDTRGLQPRVGLAWRPIAGSSLVVRAGYGIYRNTNVYQAIATMMAQQPPLSTSFSVQSTPAHPLSLAEGFVAPAGPAPNTFAIDPRFRVGYAHNWQASLQRDFPASLTVLATYLGTRGTHLMQQSLPNTYPAGAASPCPSCPSGFVYLTSTGTSSRHAGQLHVRRRLRNGLTATVQYTLARAEDDAAAFMGASLNGSTIAQDWLNLEAEWAPSNFDRRHQLTVQFQYTTGMSVTGGALMGGLAGSLFRGWTITSQLTAGSGLPYTPVYLTPAGGTGVTGSIRAALTGAPAGDAPEGWYANPAAYAPPAPGTWGDAGRNSIRGPAQFDLNAGIRRTFPFGDRMNLEWGLDAINVLNRVTYSGITTLVGSPQFGLPNSTNSMRKIQSVLRWRF